MNANLLRTARLPLAMAAWLAVFFCLLGPAASWAVTLQKMPGHVPPAAARLTPLGRLDPAKRLQVAIGLPLRNQAALTSLLQDLQNPASPSYRKFLTTADFTQRFGPTEADYQKVIAWAKSHGLAVTTTHPNRLVLDVAGTSADFEKALNVKMGNYQHPTEARQFYAPENEPSLDLATPILHISGLDTYSLPRPHLKKRPAAMQANAVPQSGTAPGGAYAGGDFRAAYVPGTNLTGAGQSVGLLQFDGYYSNDIAAYRNQFSLPNIPLVNIPVDGGVNIPSDGNGEVCLDIEMVMSMAPGVSKIYVYEAPNPSPFVDILSRMANDNLSRQLSCSWGTQNGGPDPSSEQVFLQMAAQGQSFFNATGDDDAFVGLIPFPSDSPNITQVGATTLKTTGPGGVFTSETVWNWGVNPTGGGSTGSAGGISTFYPIPVWQQGISMAGNKGSTTKRNVPDVSLTGDNVYVRYDNGSSGAFGGTSCAAPLWAGYTALVNQQAAAVGQPSVGFLNPAVYAVAKGANYTADFHDTTVGNNFSSSSPSKYAAATGFDLCTGLGTPTTALIAVLAGSPTLPPSPPNLSIDLPGGSSNRIVVSSVTGTATDNDPLTTADTLYLDWAVINSGTGPTAALLTTELYVDEVLKYTSVSEPPLVPGDSISTRDFNIGSLPLGPHTLRLKADSTNAIAESDETDNEYTRTITITAPAQTNLTTYQPAGWSDRLVVSNVTGTHTDTATLFPTDMLYLDYAVFNSGASATAAAFTVVIQLDGATVNTQSHSGAVAAGTGYANSDTLLGSLAVGTHTIRVKIDTKNTVSETDETDNEYAKTITVVNPPNLTPIKPAGWSDKIVVSKVTGTSLDDVLSPADTAYVDFAITNNGTGAVSAPFACEIYLDEVLQNTVQSGASLAVGATYTAQDFSLGALAAGTHTIRIKADAADALRESNETDNEYTKTFTVVAPPSIVNQPASTTCITGQTTTLTVSSTGAVAYQWYQGISGTTTTPVGTNAPSFTTPPLTVNTDYWVRISNTGGSVDSNTATVIVIPEPGLGATHRSANYLSPGVRAVTCQFNYPAGTTLDTLRWSPQLPSGWTLASVTGDGSPAIVNGEITFTGTLPNPVNMIYLVSIPDGQTGPQNISGAVTYLLHGRAVASMQANPDPLVISLASFHSGDSDHDGVINDAELDRMLSYWRAGAFHVDGSEVDGYAAGAGSMDGPYHSGDFLEPRWQFNGAEISRALAYWRAQSYHADGTQPDGYFPGPAGTQPGSAVAPTITHAAPATYLSSNSVTISTSFTYTGTLSALAWQPVLPTGWAVTAASGDGNPELQGGDIVWTGATLPPSPVTMTYTVSIPAGANGSQQVHDKVNYYLLGGTFVDTIAGAGPLSLLHGPRTSLAVQLTPADGGTVTANLAPDTDGKYGPSQVVTLTAAAKTGYTFASWSGDVTDTSSSIQVTMDSDKSVTATFAINLYTVTYTAGVNGSISGSASQTVQYGHSSTSVMAVPTAGYKFVQWSDGSTANPRADANVTAQIDVTAQFASARYVLSTTGMPAAGGSIVAAPLPDPDGKYTSGTVVTLTATPASGYSFANWTGAVAASTNQVQVTMNADASETASFTLLPIIRAGAYRGLIRGPAGGTALHAQNGYFTLQLTAAGKFTASALVGGLTKPIKGAFSPTGSSAAIAVVNRTTPLYKITFHIDPADVNGLITADVDFNGVAGTGVAKRLTFSARANPDPHANRYTLMTKPAMSETGRTDVPLGNGAGTLVVNTAGTATVLATLPDGTVFSHATGVAADGSWPFFGSLNRAKGFIAGWVNFDFTAQDSDGSASLDWFKPVVARTFYDQGFTTKIDALVSKYKYVRNSLLLPFASPTANAPNAVFTVQLGDLTQLPAARMLTLNPNTRITNSLHDRFALSISAGTGLFSGSFPDPVTAKPRKFQGALFQKQGRAVGFYRGTIQTGEVQLDSAAH